jgi:hypothetical protein
MVGEIYGSLLMAMGGFLLMFAVAGKEFYFVYRIIPFMIGSIWFFYGAKIFRKSLTDITISTRDFLIIFLSIFTPFIILILLDLLGSTFGGIGIAVWVVSATIIVFKWQIILDTIFPKIEKKPVHEKSEEIRRMLNPRLYSWQTEKKKENR